MWKYNPRLSGIGHQYPSNRLNKDIIFMSRMIKYTLIFYISQLPSQIPFSLIFLVKWVIRRLVLAYIGFREHNTSNSPLKLHNFLQFLNISIQVIIFGGKNIYLKKKNRSNFVESFKIAGNIFSCSLPQLKPSQQIQQIGYNL